MAGKICLVVRDGGYVLSGCMSCSDSVWIGSMPPPFFFCSFLLLIDGDFPTFAQVMEHFWQPLKRDDMYLVLEACDCDLFSLHMDRSHPYYRDITVDDVKIITRYDGASKRRARPVPFSDS